MIGMIFSAVEAPQRANPGKNIFIFFGGPWREIFHFGVLFIFYWIKFIAKTIVQKMKKMGVGVLRPL
jgi:hypothetical protein